MTDRKCANCAYRGVEIKDAKERPDYQCRRYAPRPTPNLQATTWPHVEADDWCGEYKKLGYD